MENIQVTGTEREQRPFFSVIVPVHNKGPHIRRSLTSILSQSFRNFELIIVNDASTDESLREISRFRDERIRIFHRSTPGPGGYAARNLGIRQARSAWIAFLDADDEWYSFHLSNVFDAIRRNPEAEIITAGWRISRGSEACTDDYYMRHYTAPGSCEWDIYTYIQGPRPICTIVAVIQKKLLVQAEGFDESLLHGGDTDLWLRLLLQNAKAFWIPRVQAVYHRDSVNMVTVNLFQTFTPSALTVRRFLHENPSVCGDLRVQLQKFANHISRKTFFRRIIQGELRRRDVLTTFYWRRLKPKSRVLLLLLLVSPAIFKNIFLGKFNAC